MAASRRGVFARNISSNMAGFVVAGVVALLLSPFVVQTLGKATFGMWALLTSLTGYYGLLDLGVRSAVGQYVTRYLANKDTDGVNRTMSTAMGLLIVVAILGLVLTAILTWLLPGLMEENNKTSEKPFSPAELTEFVDDVRIAMAISGVGIAIGIPMSIWAAVTYALERFEIANVIGISERLVMAGLTILVLLQGGKLIELATVTVGTQLLASVVRMVLAFRLLPSLRVTPRGFARSSVAELASYGLYNVMVNAADKIVLYMDNLIVYWFITPDPEIAVTEYEMGAKLIPHYMNLILAVTWTMTPYATSCDAKGDKNALRALLLKGTRGTVFLAAVVGTGLLLAGDEFIPLWLPKDDFSASIPILTVLAWATLARASTSCGRQILFGMRRMRTLATLAFIEAGINIALSIVFVQKYGLVGIAYGTLVSIVLVYVVGQNAILVRVMAVDGSRYVWQLLRAAVPIMTVMWFVSLWTDSWLVIDGWLPFCVLVVLLLVPVAPIGYFLVMNPDERQLVRKRLPF